MKKYKIVTNSLQFHTYIVEAESMDEAKYKIRNASTEGVEYIHTDTDPPVNDYIVHGSCEEIKL